MEAVKDQSVYIWGLFNDKEYTVPEKVKELEGKGVYKVASGGLFYLALTVKGELYGCGATKYNRFGIVSNEDILIPRLIPLKIQVEAISAGNWHSLIIDKHKQAYSVGHNKQGACGVGHFQNVDSYTPIKGGISAKTVACGDCYSLIITQDNELYSFGHADLNGQKSKTHLNEPKKLKFDNDIKSVACGFSHSLAVDEKGQTYSWGYGVFYQLGHGDKSDAKQPKLIESLAGVKMVQVSCTRGQKNNHSMALDESGCVYTWGAGYKGKLGHQGTWSHQDQADQPLPRMMKTIDYKVTKVSAGGIHSNILNEKGEILSFGCGSNGRLGHTQFTNYVYLYREGIPKAIDSLKSMVVTNLQSSYYHNICLASKP